MKTLLLAVLAFAPLAAHAGDLKSETSARIAQIDKTMTACLDSQDGQSTTGMHVCTGQALDGADKQLNFVYKTVLASLTKKTGDADSDRTNQEIVRRLEKAERAWIAFRDANSQLAGSDAIGGTLETLEIVSSRYDMTKARALELSTLFNQ